MAELEIIDGDGRRRGGRPGERLRAASARCSLCS
jgi:hypothetical protein